MSSTYTPNPRRDEQNFRYVLAVQRALNLRADGWAGEKETWPATSRALGVELQTEPLPGFRGDLARLHAWEGHQGRPYWPGGKSGVTLDPGFDLAHQTEATLRERYGFLGEQALRALAGVLGKSGAAAKAAVRRPTVAAIRVSEEQAVEVMPAIAAPYWQAIAERFPVLGETETPPTVQTALLSLAYNRGPGNDALDILAAPLAARDWSLVSYRIGDMQQGHSLAGIRRRRREEGELIRAEIA